VITAVDTSVLLDVLGADPTFGPQSKATLRSYIAEGSLVACEVVWAEVASVFPSPEAAQDALSRLGVEFSAKTALAASASWKKYRDRGGRRDRVVADFLIGAHALLQANRLLTRDRGFYRAYFSSLRMLDSSKA
jgi:hypothetical protein